MRTLITYNPFEDLTKAWSDRGQWPARWISHPEANGSEAVVQAFKLTFTLPEPKTFRIHVSADERYELFLNGNRLGRGPERGDHHHWHFETYDLSLPAGAHTLVARTWWLSRFGFAPVAQHTLRPAFLLAAENQPPEFLSTGHAPWQSKILTGYTHTPAFPIGGTGGKLHITGSQFPWGFELGQGDNWTKPTDLAPAHGPTFFADLPSFHILTPATLPPMLERPIHVGRARHVQALKELPKEELPVQAKDHLEKEADAWNKLLSGGGAVTIPANTFRRIIIDLENYYCAYTDLTTTGGTGAKIQTSWAESLYLTDPKLPFQSRPKGNRNDIEGKFFVGFGDTFEPDGNPNRSFSTLWWSAGRYLQLLISTKDQPLTINTLSLRETHYPLQWTSTFETSDPAFKDKFDDLTPIARRVMEMCSHETYMDCPYYEQLMYVGDTRLEVLTTYANTTDDRLPQKALTLFDQSRLPTVGGGGGFTQSRYPSNTPQLIAPFSAWWVAMVHDYAMWRDDPTLVKQLLPGVRSVLDTFLQHQTADHLLTSPNGWNFFDWVPTHHWSHGMPPSGDTHQISALLNFQLAWVLSRAAELEDHFGQPELAALRRRQSKQISAAAVSAFYHDPRGLFSDDLKHQHFSEHTQCLALLGNAVPEDLKPKVTDHLFTDNDLARTTIYFSHYLFETCALTNRIDPLFQRLEQTWFPLGKNGFKTTLESPEPSRSDCHAWGAHPMLHYYTTLLGIRPTSPGFKTVSIRPQLGPLTHAKATMPHPKGVIQIELAQSNNKLSGTLTLPPGLTGTLIANNQTLPLTNSTLTF